MNLDPLAILNALPEATLLRDADGMVRHVNPAAERLLDVRASDMVGGSELPGISAEELDKGKTKFEIYGLERPTMVEIVPVEGGGSLVVYRDWSWQRKAEVYQQVLSFDLISPLTAVGHAVDLLRRVGATMTQQQHDEILAIASRMGLSVKLQMLFLRDQIRYENLDASLYITVEDLTEIIRQALEPLQQSYEFTEIQIDTDRAMPPVRCDRRRMLFVLQALFRYVIMLQDHHLHITFSIENNDLAMYCSIRRHSDMTYRHNFVHLDLCRTLMEQQSGTLEFTVASETTQTCRMTLPIASEPVT